MEKTIYGCQTAETRKHQIRHQIRHHLSPSLFAFLAVDASDRPGSCL